MGLGDDLLQSKLKTVLSQIISVDTSFETATVIVDQLIGPKRTRLLHQAIAEDKRIFMVEVVRRYVREGLRVPLLIPAGAMIICIIL